MMTEKRKLSIREKADYVPAFLSIGGTAVTAPLTGPFRGTDGADTYKHHVAHAIIRKFNSRLSSIQSQYLQAEFDKLYDKWCKGKKISPQFVTTETGLDGFWVGDREKAQHVVIYYHGGGFALDGSEGHLDFWYSIQEYLQSCAIPTAFFYVMYTLTPHAVYPTQLRESVDAVRYVINECGRSPSEILLAGDSAGGNLAASVLLHLTRPCPDVEPLLISENFKGLVLMSPWVSLETSWPSFTKNKHKDYLAAEVEGRWAKEYIADHPHDEYTDPARAPAEWWQDAKADDVLVVVGSVEALYDSIESWVDRYRNPSPSGPPNRITMEVATGEVHIAPIVWPMFGDHHETEQEKSIKRWMKERLA